MPFSTPYTFATGDALTVDVLNTDLYQNMRQLGERPLAYFYSSSTVSIFGFSGGTLIYPVLPISSMDRPDVSQNYFIDTANTQTGIVLQQTGIWALGIQIAFDNAATTTKGQYYGGLMINGTTIAAKTGTLTNNGATASQQWFTLSCLWACSGVPNQSYIGDELTWFLYWSSPTGYSYAGGPSNLVNNPNSSPVFWAYRIGPI